MTELCRVCNKPLKSYHMKIVTDNPHTGVKYAEHWRCSDAKGFKSIIYKIIGYIVATVAIAMAVSFIIGVL